MEAVEPTKNAPHGKCQYLANLLRDLNVFVVHINSLYKLIYTQYVIKHPATEAKNWINLLNEAKSKEQTKQKLLKVMDGFNMNEEDYANLQYLRNTRNLLCHPRVQLSCCLGLVEKNWKNHNCYSTLKNMFETLEKNSYRRRGCERQYLQTPLKSDCLNWRARDSGDEGQGGDSDAGDDDKKEPKLNSGVGGPHGLVDNLANRKRTYARVLSSLLKEAKEKTKVEPSGNGEATDDVDDVSA